MKWEYGHFMVTCEPHVFIRLKRLFPKMLSTKATTQRLFDTPETCRDLAWFLDRYPMTITELDLAHLTDQASAYDSRMEKVRSILAQQGSPLAFPLSTPLREYQATAATMLLETNRYILADDIGLGKTAASLGPMVDARALPALVVTLTHLPSQWRDELVKFAPHLRVYIPKTTNPAEALRQGRWTIEPPDVIILGYSKLANWAPIVANYVKYVIFDECQELRTGPGSHKNNAARIVSDEAEFCLGLSATPIYNLGGEMYHVLNVIKPDALGSQTEFLREWCSTGENGKTAVTDPMAFGSFLRDQGLMLRRTAEEVGRELPPVSRIPHLIDADEEQLDAIKGRATELARMILTEKKVDGWDKLEAVREFDWRLRLATGLAKAPYVAEFVRMMIETGRPTILYGWHREVYDYWKEAFHDLNPVFYTGSESDPQKREAKRKFVEGETELFIISLRAGAGLDGLQHRTRTVVFGELDWSPGIHDQCVGRAARDGQQRPVDAFYLWANQGSDPVMITSLGVKKNQSDLIRDPNKKLEVAMASSGATVQDLAREYLKAKKVKA